MKKYDYILLISIVVVMFQFRVQTAYADDSNPSPPPPLPPGNYEGGALNVQSNASSECSEHPNTTIETGTTTGESGSPGTSGNPGESAAYEPGGGTGVHTAGGGGSISYINLEALGINTGEGVGQELLLASSGLNEQINTDSYLTDSILSCGGQDILFMNMDADNLQVAITGELSGLDFGENYQTTPEGVAEWFGDFISGNAELPTCGGTEGSGGKSQ
ncbi:MAG: hypothetical protein PVI99_01295, partial [Anaerolineales bacterium]